MSPLGGDSQPPALPACFATRASEKNEVSFSSLVPPASREAGVCLRDYQWTGQLTPYQCTSGARFACCTNTEANISPGMGLGSCTRMGSSSAATGSSVAVALVGTVAAAVVAFGIF